MAIWQTPERERSWSADDFGQQADDLISSTLQPVKQGAADALDAGRSAYDAALGTATSAGRSLAQFTVPDLGSLTADWGGTTLSPDRQPPGTTLTTPPNTTLTPPQEPPGTNQAGLPSPTAPQAMPPPSLKGFSIPDLTSLVADWMPQPAAQPTGFGAPVLAAGQAVGQAAGRSATQALGDVKIDRSSPTAFLASFVPAAQAALASKGLPTSLAPILAAIPMNEQGYQTPAPGNNYYGIKGSNPRTGANTGPVGTWEDFGGGRVNVQDTFRAYGSVGESVADFLDFLGANPRYANALQVAKSGDPAAFIRAVHQAGYATDPAWSDKILNIARQVPAVAPSTAQLPAPQAAAATTLPPASPGYTAQTMETPNLGGPRSETRGIVVHSTRGQGATPAEELQNTLNWFANPASKVSSQIVIGADGSIHQIADLNRTAYHAGPENNPNRIGIELVQSAADNDKGVPFTPAQYQSLARVTADLSRRYGFAIDRSALVGHEELEQGKQQGKTDPGKSFQWDRYIQEAAAQARAVQPPAAIAVAGPQGAAVAAQRPAAAPAAGLDVGGIERAYQGVPYTFGGPGGRGQGLGATTDCSGFVSAVMQDKFGVQLAAHTDGAYNQIKSLGGTEVGRQDARPGDVVFYMGAGTGGAIAHHMGLYAGNGQVLDMSVSGGSGVRLRPLDHAGPNVILRDPRVNPEQARTASAPIAIQPAGVAEATGGKRLTNDALNALVANTALPTGSPTAASAQPPPAAGAAPVARPATGASAPLEVSSFESPVSSFSAPALSLNAAPSPFLPGDGGTAPEMPGQRPYDPDEGPREAQSTAAAPPQAAPVPYVPSPLVAPTLPSARASTPNDIWTGGAGIATSDRGVGAAVSSAYGNVVKPALDALDAANEWVINNPVAGALNPQAGGRELAGWDQMATEVGEDTRRLQALLARRDAGDASVDAEIAALTDSLNRRMEVDRPMRERLLEAGERNPDKTAETMGSASQAIMATALAPSLGAGVVRNIGAAALDPVGQGLGAALELPGRAIEGVRAVAPRVGAALESNAARVAAADARMAQQGSATAPGAFGALTGLEDVSAIRPRVVEQPPIYPAGTPEHAVNATMRASADVAPDRLAHATAEELSALPQNPFSSVPGAKFGARNAVPLNPGGLPSTDDVRAAVNASTDHKDWYLEVADRAEQLVGQDNLPEFFTIFGITSAQTKVHDNIAATVQVMRSVRELAESGKTWPEIKAALLDMGDQVQSVYKKTGEPRFDNKGKPVMEYTRRPEIPFVLASNDKRQAIVDAYETGISEVASGAKTSSYAGSFESAGQRVFDPRTTNDMWVWRGFNVSPSGEKIAANDDDAYRFVEAVLNEIAAEKGWPGHNSQAALWATMKNIWEQAPDLARDYANGEKTLGQIVQEGSRRLVDVDGTPTPLFRVPTGQAQDFDRPEVQRVLAGVDPNLLRRPGPERALEMTRQYPGKGEIPRPSNLPFRLQERAVAEGRAPIAAVPLSTDELVAAGYDPARGVFPWLTVPHRVQESAGTVLVHLPGGTSESASYVASVLGEAAGRPMSVVAPKADATSLAGVRINAAPEQLRALSAALDAAGLPHTIGTTGGVMQIPHLGAGTTADDAFLGIIQGEAKRAGLADEALALYAGDVTHATPTEHPGAVEALQDRYRTRAGSDLQERSLAELRAAAAGEPAAVPGAAVPGAEPAAAADATAYGALGTVPGSTGGTGALGAFNRAAGQVASSAVSGGITGAVNAAGNPDDPYAAQKGFVAGALFPPLAARGIRALARRAGREVAVEGAQGVFGLGGRGAGERRAARAAEAVGAPPPETEGALARAAEAVPSAAPESVPGEALIRELERLREENARLRGGGRVRTASTVPQARPQPSGLPGGAEPIALSSEQEVARLRLDKFPEDVRPLIEEAAQDADWYHAERRGVLPDAVVQDMADDARRSVSETLRTAKVGRAWNAEETVALRNAVAGQSVKVNDLAAAVERASEADSPALIGEFTREAARLQDLVGVMEGARAEAGRSLRQWGLPARAVDDPGSFGVAVVKKFGDDKARVLGLISEYNQAVRAGASPIELSKHWARVMNDPVKATDLFSLYRRMNMLSGPRTFEVNALSGSSELAYDALSRVGGRLATGRPGEAADIITAPVHALRRAGRNFFETLGQGITTEQAARGDVPRSAAARMEPGLGRKVVTAMEVPDRINAATDQFIRTLAEQMIGTDEALRSTRGLSATERADRVAELLANPTPEMAGKIKEGADRITFSGDMGDIGRRLQTLQQAPIVGNIVLPFLRTVYNITARGIDRSPLGLATTAQELIRSAPGISKVGRGGYREGLQGGGGVPPIGARLRDNIVGTAAAWWAFDAAENGDVTGMGPDDPEKRAELRRTGWRPYSIKIGGQYWSYANFGPMAFPLAMGAAASEARKYAKDDATTAAMLGDAAKRFGSMVTETSVVSGIGAIVKAQQDPERYGAQWLTQFLQTLVPVGSGLNTVGQALDTEGERRPDRSDLGTQIAQGVMTRIPQNPLTPDRGDVPLAQDPLGGIVPNNQAGFGALDPFRRSPETPDRTINIFLDAGVDIGKPPTSIRDKAGKEYPLSDAQQRQYQTVAGRIIQERTANVADDLSFLPLPDRQKRLQGILRDARAQAEDQIALTVSGMGARR